MSSSGDFSPITDISSGDGIENKLDSEKSGIQRALESVMNLKTPAHYFENLIPSLKKKQEEIAAYQYMYNKNKQNNKKNYWEEYRVVDCYSNPFRNINYNISNNYDKY